MSHVTDHIDYGEQRISFSVCRRQRRTLEIAVEPDMRVTVTAPQDALEEDIRSKVRKRARWIRRQQTYFRQFHPATPERRYLPGETHCFLGRAYRLLVMRSDADETMLRGSNIVVGSLQPERPDRTKRILDAWYQARAKETFRELIEQSLDRFHTPDLFRPSGLIVRRLKQRWGSMSPNGRLVLNRRLVEAPIDAIDYVIVHELCHIEQPNHGPEFFQMLERYLPDWMDRKQRLERYMA